MLSLYNCYSAASVCMTNVQLYDLTALPYAPPPPTGVTANGTSSSQINLDWNLDARRQQFRCL